MDYLERLKDELDSFSDDMPTITVSRKDLEKLIHECESRRKGSDENE